MNLLVDPVFSVSDGGRTTLPGLFAAMARGQVRGFPALRPYQRPAWHMFLVQLGALAAYWAPDGGIPRDEAVWASNLRGLTPNHPDDAPWRLDVYDRRKPAFLQPPDPGQLKWSTVRTPDELDMLITARNHDLKVAVASDAAPEDWVLALISLQTCEGYGGGGNYGIARMNGGSSSRPMLALAPARSGGLSLDPSSWWQRDVRRLLRARGTGGRGEARLPALLWCVEWPEGQQLQPQALDPWFIEVCRRVRLDVSNGGLSAMRSASRKSRIAAWRLQGNTGDPWAPVHSEDGRCLTLGYGEFDYKRLCDLLFSGNWERPLLSCSDAGETGNRILVAEAFSRGNIKTEGFQSRLVQIPEDMVALITPESPVAALAEAQSGEVWMFDQALRDALALVAAGGGMAAKRHFRHSHAARKRFDRDVDRLFFESLWRRVRADAGGDAARISAQTAFLADLLRIAEFHLDAALPATPCPAVSRPRAETRARRRLRNTLWKNFPQLFENGLPENTSGGGEGTPTGRTIAKAAASAAEMLRGLAPGPLAEARRVAAATGTSAYWEMAARYPRTIGHRDNRQEWMAAIRILAILTEPPQPAWRSPPRVSERRLGEALCDGGDPYAWPRREGRLPHPVYSERRLADLMAARGQRRSALLERAARMLVRRRVPGCSVSPADVALFLLEPEDWRLVADPYYQRLDRARWNAARAMARAA